MHGSRVRGPGASGPPQSLHVICASRADAAFTESFQRCLEGATEYASSESCHRDALRTSTAIVTHSDSFDSFSIVFSTEQCYLLGLPPPAPCMLLARAPSGS